MTPSLTIAVLLATTAAPLDSAGALARARELSAPVSAGDAAALWSVFDERMRGAMKDSVSFVARMAGMHQQLGAIDTVLTEELGRQGDGYAYRARCRFANVPIPVELTIGLAPDGRVSGLSVRPAEERKAHPSPHLEYQTQSRLELPFEGAWFVFWGGRTLEQNYHVVSRSQRFAHDLVIRKDGRSYRTDGQRLQDYWSYGARVLAPAAGTVVWKEDGHPDQELGKSDPAHPIGNGVILDHGHGEFSLLAHLQPGSIPLKVGDKVRSGQLLGLCGNSGNTSEPHIHYHLQNGPDPKEADGLPAFFVDLVVDGRKVSRAEIVRGQQVSRGGTRQTSGREKR